jgi:tRNA U34 2-thiouridine synthase MnmA/TrmU
MKKAVAMLSGGLDSTLAIRVLQDQNIEMAAINFITVFCTCSPKDGGCLISKKVADQLGIPLKVCNVSQEYLEIVKNPRFGYGRNMNPCIDCRIFMLKKAAAYMREVGASFLVTGEVLGERPMSQRRDAMRIIERESGLDGLILRPLSAKLLKPTIPEMEGWVDRERLLNIQGRSRKPQMELADAYHIHDYPCPAGGCLLTDPQFGKRMKDLITHEPDFTLNDVHLLKMGRHFRLSPKTKVIVGRREEENRKILSFAREGDLVFRAADFPGAITLARGRVEAQEIEQCASVTLRYSKAPTGQPSKVCYQKPPNSTEMCLAALPKEDLELESLRIT